MKERPKRLKAADTQTEEETRNEDLLSRGRLQHATTAKDNDSANTGSMWHPSSTLRAYSTLSAVDNLVHSSVLYSPRRMRCNRKFRISLLSCSAVRDSIKNSKSSAITGFFQDDRVIALLRPLSKIARSVNTN